MSMVGDCLSSALSHFPFCMKWNIVLFALSSGTLSGDIIISVHRLQFPFIDLCEFFCSNDDWSRWFSTLKRHFLWPWFDDINPMTTAHCNLVTSTTVSDHVIYWLLRVLFCVLLESDHHKISVTLIFRNCWLYGTMDSFFRDWIFASFLNNIGERSYLCFNSRLNCFNFNTPADTFFFSI